MIHLGSPTHRQQACPAPYQARRHHRMVMLATGPPSCGAARSYQIPTATVMLVCAFAWPELFEDSFESLTDGVFEALPDTGDTMGRQVADHDDTAGLHSGIRHSSSHWRKIMPVIGRGRSCGVRMPP